MPNTVELQRPASSDLMRWQLTKLTGQLMLLSDHAIDQTCPCELKDETYEFCVPKHLIAVAAYCEETIPMTDKAELKELLESIQGGASDLRREYEKAVGKDKEPDRPGIAEFARESRKAIEPFLFTYKMVMQQPVPGLAQIIYDKGWPSVAQPEPVEVEPTPALFQNSLCFGGGKMAKHSRRLLTPGQISDFDPSTDIVVRESNRTFVVDKSGQRAKVEVQSDVITPEIVENLKKLTPEQKVKMAEAIKLTPYLSTEGKVERLAVLTTQKNLCFGGGKMPKADVKVSVSARCKGTPPKCSFTVTGRHPGDVVYKESTTDKSMLEKLVEQARGEVSSKLPKAEMVPKTEKLPPAKADVVVPPIAEIVDANRQSYDDYVKMLGKEPNTKRYRVELEALTKVPIWEDRRGNNWLARISLDPTAPGGLQRVFQDKARGDYYYMVTGLSIGDSVEFGADYIRSRGRDTKRWYGVVSAKTSDWLYLTKTPDARTAIKLSEELKPLVQDWLEFHDPLLASVVSQICSTGLCFAKETKAILTPHEAMRGEIIDKAFGIKKGDSIVSIPQGVSNIIVKGKVESILLRKYTDGEPNPIVSDVIYRTSSSGKQYTIGVNQIDYEASGLTPKKANFANHVPEDAMHKYLKVMLFNQVNLCQARRGSTTVEEAKTICQRGNEIIWGNQSKGETPYNVRLNVGCPPGSTPIGTWHSHPGGTTKPSGKDIAEMQRMGLENLCISDDQTTKCFKVK